MKRLSREPVKLKVRNVEAAPLTGAMARDECMKRPSALHVTQRFRVPVDQ